jgi:carbohydrate kinase (thermoresistant glucokinase family)
MGVAGCGKTTLGQLVAEEYGWPFLDADSLHSAAAVEKMRDGIPLTDEDRWPWLDRVAAWIAERREHGESGIVACSALKRAYRDRLRKADPQLRLVYLDGTAELLADRLAGRHGHFFHRGLLDAQLAALEVPGPDEAGVSVPIGHTIPEEVAAIRAALDG